MSKEEFVVINQEGKEVDWVDPIIELRETRCYWWVDNGYHTYRYFKREGWQYIRRNKSDE